MPNLIIDNTPALGADIQNLAAINGGQLAGLRNRIINGNFGINQRGMVSPVTGIAVGQYAHDRWCGGTAASAYSFSTTANVTTITITSGTIKQIVEGLNLESGTYSLSWEGTAQGKIGAGSYGASGVQGVIVGGTNTTIEFNTGTVSKVQLEIGTPTVFEQRPYSVELALCQRYYQRFLAFSNDHNGYFKSYFGGSNAVTEFLVSPMRVFPTASILNSAIEYYNFSAVWTATALTALSYSDRMISVSCITDGDGRGKLLRSGSAGTGPGPVVILSAEL